MENNITGVLIDVKNETAEIKTVPKELGSYYDMLNCQCIDITRRTIGGKSFEIVCDDEGLFTQPKISAISNLGEAMLVGNLFVVGFNQEEYDITSLTQDEVEHVMKYVQTMYTKKYPKGYKMLTQVEY